MGRHERMIDLISDEKLLEQIRQKLGYQFSKKYIMKLYELSRWELDRIVEHLNQTQQSGILHKTAKY